MPVCFVFMEVHVNSKLVHLLARRGRQNKKVTPCKRVCPVNYKAGEKQGNAALALTVPAVLQQVERVGTDKC